VSDIPLTADGLDTAEIMRRTGKSKSVVWRWQKRFMHAGVDGLLARQDPTLAQAGAQLSGVPPETFVAIKGEFD
jgi:hypothetical protein